MLDLESALERLANDKELYAAVAEAYLEDITPKMEALNQAILDDDMNTLSRVCHSLKGTSSTIGADSCFELAKVGEVAAGEGQKEAALKTVAELKSALIAVSAELRTYLQNN
ncbi:MAG: Hpt domain-containing protein [Desulfovibrio sp.]